jgi:hypothetical protein
MEDHWFIVLAGFKRNEAIEAVPLLYGRRIRFSASTHVALLDHCPTFLVICRRDSLHGAVAMVLTTITEHLQVARPRQRKL